MYLPVPPREISGNETEGFWNRYTRIRLPLIFVVSITFVVFVPNRASRPIAVLVG
jgi:hypothetical protein